MSDARCLFVWSVVHSYVLWGELRFHANGVVPIQSLPVVPSSVLAIWVYLLILVCCKYSVASGHECKMYYYSYFSLSYLLLICAVKNTMTGFFFVWLITVPSLRGKMGAIYSG